MNTRQFNVCVCSITSLTPFVIIFNSVLTTFSNRPGILILFFTNIFITFFCFITRILFTSGAILFFNFRYLWFYRCFFWCCFCWSIFTVSFCCFFTTIAVCNTGTITIIFFLLRIRFCTLFLSRLLTFFNWANICSVRFLIYFFFFFCKMNGTRKRKFYNWLLRLIH